MTAIQAVFFDIDGVIIDTERDGHRVSFNLTFKEFGFTDEWDVEYYHELQRPHPEAHPQPVRYLGYRRCRVQC